LLSRKQKSPALVPLAILIYNFESAKKEATNDETRAQKIKDVIAFHQTHWPNLWSTVLSITFPVKKKTKKAQRYH
jgi:hypothetical protein